MFTNTQISKTSKAFGNSSSADTKFSKTQLSKIHSRELMTDIFGVCVVSDTKSGLGNFIKGSFKLLNI